MNLKELNPPLTERPAGQTFFRVQLLRARPGSVTLRGLLLHTVVDAARRSGVPLLCDEATA